MWFSFVPVVLLVIIIVLLFIFLPLIKEKPVKIKNSEKSPQGAITSQWMGIGIALGIPMGIIFSNISLGIPIGLCLGLVIGSLLEERAKSQGKIRPLTKKEIKQRHVLISILTGLLLLGLICFGLFMLFFR